MPLPEIKNDHKYTYKEYKTWPDEERWELINGIAYNMSPAPSRKHQDISRKLQYILYSFLKDKSCELYNALFDVFLPKGREKEDDIDTVVQPDLVVICDKTKLTEKGCLGAPDIIIEITSPNTGAKDKIEKLNLYENHKVKEYWILDQTDNTTMIFHLENDQYGKPHFYNAEDVIITPLLEGLKIPLKEVFNYK